MATAAVDVSAAATPMDTEPSTATQTQSTTQFGHPVFLHYQDIPGDDVIFDRDDDGKKIKLGDGGFGVVYKGVFRQLPGHKVAIKKMKKCGYGIKQKDIKYLKREGAIHHRMRHPDIVTVFGMTVDDTNQESQLYCIVSEYMEMGSLEELMEKVLIPWEVKVRMFEGVARGMAYVCGLIDDRGYKMVHGDIKAQNILIDGHFRAKIGDFCISAVQTITSRTTHLYFNGTLTHVAPELLDIKEDDDGNYDPAPTESSDVYSFGITMFEAAAEKKPPKDSPEYGHPRYRRPFSVKMTDSQLRYKINRNMNSVLTPQQKQQKIPEDCPQFYIELMDKCCIVDKDQRPTFKMIIEELHKNFEGTMSKKHYAAMAKLYSRFKKEMPTEEDLWKSQQEEEEYSKTFDGSIFMKENRTYRNFNFKSKVGHVTIDDWNNLKTEVKKLRDFADRRAWSERDLDREREDIAMQMSYFRGPNSPINFNDMEEIRKELLTVNRVSWNMREELKMRGEIHQSRAHLKESLIRLNYVFLMSNVLPMEIKDHLFQDGILTGDDLERIRAGKTRRDKNEFLLRKVDLKGDKGVKSLVNALDSTEQQFVADAIRNGYKMKNLRTYTDLLMYNMKVERVFTKLYSCGILDCDDKDLIRSEPRQSFKVLFIIDAIDRSGPAAVQTLIDILEETGQNMLANKLKKIPN